MIDLYLTTPVRCKRPKFENFDKDGFDLTLFEALCYETSGYVCDHTTNHLSCRREWITSLRAYKARIHHSYQCFRMGFRGDLAKQIKELSAKYEMPELLRLLHIRPKVGLDLNIEYNFGEGEVMDLFHYEEDFLEKDVGKFESRLEEIEDLVTNTNWDMHALKLMDRRLEWRHLYGDDENDYKARLLGFDRAYKTHKVV